MSIDIAVVIVSYNVSALLRKCLQTVLASEGDVRFKVIVVDNNSKDDTVEMVRNEFPTVVCIANNYNAGYPAANNQGLKELGIYDEDPPRYGLLLNPDTELPSNCLQYFVDYMDQNQNVGVAGPKLVLPNGSLDLACRRSFPSPTVSVYRMLGLSKIWPKSERFGRYNMTYLPEDQLAEVDSVVGAFMLVRTDAIHKVGLLDETFWMYGEDLDWAKRIKDAGWKVIYNPEVEVLHVKRASSKQNPRAQFEFFRAMPIFYYKHYRSETPLWLHWLVILGLALRGGPKLWPELKESRYQGVWESR
ncbi:MAG: glycosyltransferase family 2 protein [Chloroflexota bacterium]